MSPKYSLTAIVNLAHVYKFLVVQFSCSVVSDVLWSHGLEHARPPCPSPPSGAYSNSCPSSGWCHPTISSSVISFSSCLQSFPASGSFPMNESVLRIRWAKYWSFSFSISPSNEQTWLMDWACTHALVLSLNFWTSLIIDSMACRLAPVPGAHFESLKGSGHKGASWDS